MKSINSIAVTTLVLLCNWDLSGQPEWVVADDSTTKPRAVRHGEMVEITPLGATLEIPAEWLAWQKEFHNNIHLTSDELAAIRVAPDVEWDDEYGRIANAVFPFEQCVMHAGDEGWGNLASSFSDVQLRAYVVEDTVQCLRQRMQIVAPREALRFSKKISASTSRFEKWDRVTVSYALWYSDYGGVAKVDVFMRPVGKQTVALVFMYSEETNSPGEVVDIVKSFKTRP